MQIADKPAQALIKVEKDNDFITAHLFFKTDDQELIRANKTPWDILGVIIKNNTLHFIDNYHSVILAKSKIGVFKMPVTHKEIFYKKVIEPLSKHFILEFEEDTFNNESYELDFSSKQIFLSEKDQYLIIRPQVKYDNGKEVILTNIGNLIEKQEDKIIEYKRNYELEEFFLNEIAELHPSFEEQKSNKIFYIHYEDFMEKMWFFKFFEQMQQKHIEVYGLKNLKNFKYSPYKGKISTSINSGIDWFDVNITMSFGNNEVSLQDIKKAVINKERYILLKDGSVGILPEEWFHKLEKYFRNGEINKNKLKISKLRFSIIDELFDNIDNDKIVKELAQKRKLLEQFKKIDKVTVPKNIKAELRNYQKEGLNWLYFLKKMKWGGILADDMGLGKTLQILSFIQKDLAKQKKAHLIVVPTTLLFNWQKEIEKFAPDIKALYHYGPDRAKDTKDFNKFHIIFTTYGILLRDIELLKTYRFKYMILDESQAIKNPASRRYKAASLIQAENKLALTGTPIENSTFDLYAQMNFVNPGFLGSLNSFKKNYSNPIDKEGNETIASELQKIINPFVLRRTKEQVAKELPPKIEDIIYCEMSEEQRKVYEAYKNNYRNKILKKIEKDGLNKSKLFVLEALTRLRQICDSPLLLKDDEIQITESIKIKEIVNHITEKTANHKVLIFSQFVEMLSLLRKELEKLNIDYEYLDGKSSTTQREASVNNFQTNNYLRVFLISLKAGGTGLNLTAADYVYILDPWWNPAVENQAIDRCYRIGQDKHVFAYRMICKNTIEEKILDLQSKKKKIATDIIQTDENIIKTIDIKDIKELLG
jgi:SNF2 family DNA or RNA helicase